VKTRGPFLFRRVSDSKSRSRRAHVEHGVILEAIAEKTDREAQSAEFRDTAEKRYANIVASGKTIPWRKMRRYFEDRLAGKTAARPAARKLAR
jgi:hypothetical protein